MGCYGIGVSRTPAAAVEQHHDDKGIVWPVAIAPFECVVAILDKKRPEQQELAERLYGELREAGVDVCLDDRPLSPGAKFKDHELMGMPVQVFVGRKAGEGQVELLVRKGLQKSECAADEVVGQVKAALAPRPRQPSPRQRPRHQPPPRHRPPAIRAGATRPAVARCAPPPPAARSPPGRARRPVRGTRRTTAPR
jgi:hypothetical protein